MTSLYDSAPSEIGHTLAESPTEFGPRLGNGYNIKLFLEDNALKLRDIET